MNSQSEINPISAQFSSNPQFGGRIGISLNIGTHIINSGIVIGGFYSDFFYQVNLESQLKWNLKSYANRKKFWENRNALGLVLLGGKRNLIPDFQMDALNHQSSFSNGIAYNYLWYFDKAQTSQRSGGWAVHVNYFSVVFENDVFGGQAKDRFRTGILNLSYRYEDWKFFSQFYIWTGETKHSPWIKVSMPGMPYGYRSLEDLPYGRTSHGIWSFGVHRNFGNQQIASFQTGIDSEHLRHAFQNRFSHDLILFPKKMKRNTPHYPRLDEDGCPTFEKETVRKNKFFFQADGIFFLL